MRLLHLGPAHILKLAALDAKVWWPLFPLLLLVVVVALSGAVIGAIRQKKSRTDLGLQILALGCYLLTAVIAVASEGSGSVPASLHRVPSLLTQMILLVQLVRIWKRPDARTLRVLNMIAWGAILADTALHYLMARG